MKKVITAMLPFALFAMALTSCGGSKPSEDIKVESINFTLEKSEAVIGEQVKITNIEVLPANATNRGIEWTLQHPDAGEIHTMGEEPYVVGKVALKTTVIAAARDGGGATKAVDIEFKDNVVLVTALDLSVDPIVGLGKEATINVTVTPSTATNKDWEVKIEQGSDHVELTQDGHCFKGTSVGEVKFHVEAKDAGHVKSKTETVTVAAIPATKIEIFAEDQVLSPEDTTTLWATWDPDDASVDQDDITYEVTSGDGVVTIDGDTVTAVKNGTATITGTLSQAGEDDLTDTVEITVEDDLLVGAKPASKKEVLPFEYIEVMEDGSNRTSVVKLDNVKGTGWNSTQFEFHSGNINSGTLSFDVKSEGLTNDSFDMRFYDSKWNEIHKKFTYTTATDGSWTTINTNLYLAGEHTNHEGDQDYNDKLEDLTLIRIYLKDATDSTGSLYIDNVKFVKGATFTAKPDNLFYEDYKCVKLPNTYANNRVGYIEMKAQGTGSIGFLIGDSDWKNITGSKTFSFTNGVPSGSDIIDTEDLSDGWYGITFILNGGEIKTATDASLFSFSSFTDLTSITIDFNSFISKPHVFTNASHDNYDKYSYIIPAALKEDNSNAFQFMLKGVPATADVAQVEIRMHKTGWTNLTGILLVEFDSSGAVTAVTAKTVSSKSVSFKLIEDGWYLISIDHDHMYDNTNFAQGNEISILEFTNDYGGWSNLSELYVDFNSLDVVDIA